MIRMHLMVPQLLHTGQMDESRSLMSTFDVTTSSHGLRRG